MSIFAPSRGSFNYFEIELGPWQDNPVLVIYAHNHIEELSHCFENKEPWKVLNLKYNFSARWGRSNIMCQKDDKARAGWETGGALDDFLPEGPDSNSCYQPSASGYNEYIKDNFMGTIRKFVCEAALTFAVPEEAEVGLFQAIHILALVEERKRTLERRYKGKRDSQ